MQHMVKLAILCSAAIAGLAAAPVSKANAFVIGGVVYDPTNHAQNVLSASRALIMVQNQASQLANEAEMIAQEARHLERMSYSSRETINAGVKDMEETVKSLKSFSGDVEATRKAFRALYPETYDDWSNSAMGEHMEAQRREARRAFLDAIVMQAAIPEASGADREVLSELASASENAVGALQATQTGNQLSALQAKQAIQTANLLTVYFRAEAIDRARSLQSAEHARIHRRRFLGDGSAYTRK